MIYTGKDASLNPPVLLYRPEDPKYRIANVPWMSAPAVAKTKNGRLYMTFNTGADDPISDTLTLSMSDDDGISWDECVWAVTVPEGIRIHEPLVWAAPDGTLRVSWIQSFGTWDGRGGLWISVLTGEDSDHPVLSEPRRVCNGIMANDPVFEPDGDWLLPVCVWNWDSPGYGNRFSRYSMVYRSVDGGLTADRVGCADIPRRTFDEASLARLSDRRLMMLVRTEYGWGCSFSEDDGHTWSKAGEFRRGPSAKSLIRNLPDGRLLWAGYDTDRPVRERIAVFISDDDGRTWPHKLLLDPRENVSYPNTHITEDGTVYITHDYDRQGAKECVLHKVTVREIEEGRLSDPGSYLGRVAFR